MAIITIPPIGERTTDGDGVNTLTHRDHHHALGEGINQTSAHVHDVEQGLANYQKQLSNGGEVTYGLDPNNPETFLKARIETDESIDHIIRDDGQPSISIQEFKDDTTTKLADRYTKSEVDDLVDEKLDKDFAEPVNNQIMTEAGVTITSDGQAMTLDKSYINPINSATSQDTTPLPIASSSNVGLMPPSDVQAIQNHEGRLDVLEAGVPLNFLTDFNNAVDPSNPTQVEAQEAYESVSGKTGVALDGTVLMHSSKVFYFKWFATSNLWVMFSGGQGAVIAPPATNISTGTVTGSIKDGQIYVENDNTLSVNGWDEVKADISTATNNLTIVTGDLASHTSNTSNPHSVTKTQVGLSYVDNTSDADKPVSVAQSAAISTAQSTAISTAATALSGHTARADNPHSVTATQVGLGNLPNAVDNLPTSNSNNLVRSSGIGPGWVIGPSAATVSDWDPTTKTAALTFALDVSAFISNGMKGQFTDSNNAIHFFFFTEVTGISASIQAYDDIANGPVENILYSGAATPFGWPADFSPSSGEDITVIPVTFQNGHSGDLQTIREGNFISVLGSFKRGNNNNPTFGEVIALVPLYAGAVPVSPIQSFRGDGVVVNGVVLYSTQLRYFASSGVFNNLQTHYINYTIRIPKGVNLL